MQIENYRESANASNVKVIATFDLVLDKAYLTLKNWKVVRKKDGGWFACSPSFKLSEDDAGKPSFESYVIVHEKRRLEFNKALHEQLSGLVK